MKNHIYNSGLAALTDPVYPFQRRPRREQNHPLSGLHCLRGRLLGLGDRGQRGREHSSVARCSCTEGRTMGAPKRSDLRSRKDRVHPLHPERGEDVRCANPSGRSPGIPERHGQDTRGRARPETQVPPTRGQGSQEGQRGGRASDETEGPATEASSPAVHGDSGRGGRLRVRRMGLSVESKGHQHARATSTVGRLSCYGLLSHHRAVHLPVRGIYRDVPATARGKVAQTVGEAEHAPQATPLEVQHSIGASIDQAALRSRTAGGPVRRDRCVEARDHNTVRESAVETRTGSHYRRPRKSFTGYGGPTPAGTALLHRRLVPGRRARHRHRLRGARSRKDEDQRACHDWVASQHQCLCH